MIPLVENANGYTIYGEQNIEEGAKDQMKVAMKLPVTVAGSLMPDAHQGYGLPIGGVLAAKNAIIPYGVGVDILIMIDKLVRKSLRNIIRRYENRGG